MKMRDLEASAVEETSPISPPPFDFVEVLRRMSAAGAVRLVDVERDLANLVRAREAIGGEASLRDAPPELIDELVEATQRRERLATLVEGLQPMTQFFARSQ
jgi:hypothetical protein